jgi:outer membrane protein assembly factor BamB
MSLRNASLLALVTIWLTIATAASAAEYPRNPLALGDSIYVSHQGVYRFDAAHTEPLWISLAGVETFAPVAYRDLLLVGSTQGLYALRLADGSVAWHIEKQHSLFSPTLGEQAYAGSVHGELYAIAPQDGSIRWRRAFDGWIYSPAINTDASWLWTGGQAHEVYALSSDDGEVTQKIPTSQESVFRAVDLGDARVAFNLFDGSSVVINSDNGQVESILAGDAQPTAILRRGDKIYRGHSDGSLSAFASKSLQLEWRRALLTQGLIVHPSQPGYLLLGDQDRKLLLMELVQHSIQCEFEPDGQWLLPIQVESDKILFFRKSMQPPRLRLVKPPATCH